MQEVKLLGSGFHLLLSLFNELFQFHAVHHGYYRLGGQGQGAIAIVRAGIGYGIKHAVVGKGGLTQDFGVALAHGAWRDAVLLVVGGLGGAATIRLVNGALHGAGDAVGVHNHLAPVVSGGPAHGLNQAALVAQEAFFVGIENSHQAHFGQVEALAQQVHANQHVDFAQAQLAQDFHAVQSFYVGVHILDFDAEAVHVLAQLLSHALGEGRHQHSVAHFHPLVYLVQQVVNLVNAGANIDFRVEQASGADNLLHYYAAGLSQLVVRRRSRHIYRLLIHTLELVKGQRPVV